MSIPFSDVSQLSVARTTWPGYMAAKNRVKINWKLETSSIAIQFKLFERHYALYGKDAVLKLLKLLCEHGFAWHLITRLLHLRTVPPPIGTGPLHPTLRCHRNALTGLYIMIWVSTDFKLNNIYHTPARANTKIYFVFILGFLEQDCNSSITPCWCTFVYPLLLRLFRPMVSAELFFWALIWHWVVRCSLTLTFTCYGHHFSVPY